LYEKRLLLKIWFFRLFARASVLFCWLFCYKRLKLIHILFLSRGDKLQTDCKKKLSLFLTLHVLVFSLLPLMRACLPMDTLEALIWGGYWEFGTNKHPFLSGFAAWPFYNALFESDFSMYLLSQICVAAGLIYLYKLAKLFVSAENAVLSVMLMEGVAYYNVLSVEYNVNVLSLIFWPATVYYFCRAMRTDRLKHWILLGVAAGLNLMTKYSAAFLLASIGLYLVFTKKGRAQMKRPGAYVTFVVCLAVAAPHVYWLYKYDFFPFEYIFTRGGAKAAHALIGHLIYPVEFIAAQVAACVAALALYGFLWRNAGEKSAQSFENKQFLFFTGVMPLFITASFALVTGSHMKSMWGYPLPFMLGLLLCAFFPVRQTPQIRKTGTITAYALMAGFALILIASNVFKTRERVLFSPRAFAAEMTQIWRDKYRTPLKYVGGDVWYASMVSLYSPDRPTAVADNLKTNPWLDAGDILQNGALLTVVHPDVCAAFAPNETLPSKPVTRSYTMKSLAGKRKTIKMHYCFLPPKN